MINITKVELDVSNNNLILGANIDTSYGFIPETPIKASKLSITNNEYSICIKHNIDNILETEYDPKEIRYFTVQILDPTEFSQLSDKYSSVLIGNIEGIKYNITNHKIKFNSNLFKSNIKCYEISEVLEDVFTEKFNLIYELSDSLKNFDIFNKDSLYSFGRSSEFFEKNKEIQYEVGIINPFLKEELENLPIGNEVVSELGNKKIEAHEPYYKNCKFSKIYIDTQNTLEGCGSSPSEYALEDFYTINPNSSVLDPKGNGIIDLNSFKRPIDLKKDILFIWLSVSGDIINAEELPPEKKRTQILLLVYNGKSVQYCVYNRIKNIKTKPDCSISCTEVLPIMWYKAFQLAFLNKDLSATAMFWKLIFNDDVCELKPCCNG